MQIILNPRMELLITKGFDQRHYNLPTTNEVAMIIPVQYQEASCRDIIQAPRYNTIEGTMFRTITSSYATYTTLHYVLLFPFGEPGWNWALRLQHSQTRDGLPKRLSQRQYQFRLHSRLLEPTTLILASRLFQQYVVDAWLVVDQATLEWIPMNQASLRSDLYNGLADAIVEDAVDISALGGRIVLPSSFLGSDRFIQQLFQDSIAIV